MTGSSADLIVTNAVVHTLDEARPHGEALAVRDGQLAAVGTNEEVHALHGANTEVVDLAGAVVLPGLVDVHVHHALAGENDLHHLQVPATASVTEIVDTVRHHVAQSEPGTWIIGEAWGSGLLAELSTPDPLAALDAASPGHPVLLTDDTHHNKWANTEAMRLAGLFDLDHDPDGGHIVRTADGAPTGLLVERAGLLVEQRRVAGLDRDVAYHARNSERGIELLHEHGITAFQDAGASLDMLAGLQHLDDQGRLHAWAVTSMLINDFVLGADVLGDELITQGETFRTHHHRPDFGKIFLDGVPTTRTGAFLEPYLPDETHGACIHGTTTMPVAELDTWLRRARRAGIGLKVHCTGDASARMVLDAVAQLRAEGTRSPAVHIAHGQYLHPDDVPRFGELDVASDVSPPLMFPSATVDALRAVRPEPRASQLTPARDLLAHGALVAGGSDWPVSPSPNPWVGIAGLVTRQDPMEHASGTLWPEQAISVHDAIAAYTSGAARAMGLGNVTGSLMPGLAADFVVLDRDPFSIPTTDLGNVTTRQTWFAGRRVFHGS